LHGIAILNKDDCGKCPHFALCVGERKEKRRQLCVTKYHKYNQQRREEQKTSAFKKEMKVRAQIEGTISEAVRFHGLHYKKYKGALGDALQFYFTGAAINVKRILRVLSGRIKDELV